MSEVQDSAEGIFTQKQREYVNSVTDENLRQSLLHQVRLRDLMTEDRDRALQRIDVLEKQIPLIKRQFLDEITQFLDPTEKNLSMEIECQNYKLIEALYKEFGGS